MHFFAVITSLILLSTTPGSWNCDVTAVATSGEIAVDKNTEEDVATDDKVEEEKFEEKKDVSLEKDLSEENKQIEEKSDKTDVYEDLFVKQNDLDDTFEDDFSGENDIVIIEPDVITDVIEENTKKSEENKDIVESNDGIELPVEIVEIEDVTIPYFDRIFRHVMWVINSSNYEREEDIPLSFVRRSEAATIFTAGLFAVLMFAIFWFAYFKRKEEEKKSKKNW